MEPWMEYRLLGPLEVLDGERPLSLGPPKHRVLLAALLLQANQVVTVERLVAVLWGDEPPRSAEAVLRVYVSNLRKRLPSAGGAESPHATLATRPGGYHLRVAPNELDLYRFEQLVEEAGRARTEGDPQRAAALLREGLALWRGPALVDVDSEPLRRVEAPRLEESRLTAIEERIELDLLLGRHAPLVAELRALCATHPLRERFQGQLMLALYRRDARRRRWRPTAARAAS
jgi:DNA-binding SARP family transcriptional activator